MTGVVHFFLLRPMLDLEGLSYACDKLLHVVVPILAVVGWLVFGPRPRVTWRAIGWALVWPMGWLAWTLVFGALDGWYPYPFLDHDQEGWASVVVTCIAITALFLMVFTAARLADRRLSRRG